MCCWQSDVPSILSACLISLEPDSNLRLFTDQYTPDERFGLTASNCQLSTPKDASCTHILVFPTSAKAQVIIIIRRFYLGEQLGSNFNGNTPKLIWRVPLDAFWGFAITFILVEVANLYQNFVDGSMSFRIVFCTTSPRFLLLMELGTWAEAFLDDEANPNQVCCLLDWAADCFLSLFCHRPLYPICPCCCHLFFCHCAPGVRPHRYGRTPAWRWMVN